MEPVCESNLQHEALGVSVKEIRDMSGQDIVMTASLNVPVCRVCLVSGCRLYFMPEGGNLCQGYEMVTGLTIGADDCLPRYLCSECAARLQGCARFRSRSLGAHRVLLDTLRRHQCVTPDSIKSVIGSQHSFKSSLRVSYRHTNHYDLEVKHEEDENIHTEGQAHKKNNPISHRKNILDSIQSENDELKKNASPAEEMDNPHSVYSPEHYIKVELDVNDARDTNVEENGITEKPESELLTQNVVVKVERSDLDVSKEEQTDGGVEEKVRAEEIVVTYDIPCVMNHYRSSDDDQASKERMYPCEVCKKVFGEENLLREHLIIHSVEERYSCTVCTKSFNGNLDLQKHLKVHTGDKEFTCELCQKMFRAYTNLENHLRMHLGEKPFVCEICKKAFGRKDYLRLHRRVHTGEKPYTCKVCKKSYKKRASLNNHLKIHFGDKAYTCEVCVEGFPDQDKLRKHLKVHYGEKEFACQVCQKKFNCDSTLRVHLRAHSGERPFSCDVCKKSFSVKSNLRNHIKIHSGQKPHKCDVCKKSFFGMNYLRKHMRSHSGVKPFACDVCKQEFTTKRNREKHFRGKHSGKV